jgi:hypothetical protein
MIYELATEYELDIVNSVLIGNSKYEELIAKKSGISKYIDISSLTLQST